MRAVPDGASHGRSDARLLAHEARPRLTVGQRRRNVEEFPTAIGELKGDLRHIARIVKEGVIS